MEIKIHEINREKIAEIIANHIVISKVQDALDLMADCDYQGARKIIVHKENIVQDFFDLKTGLAGEILQKFSTYRISFAIIGDFSNIGSKSLSNFIYESNKKGQILFVSSADEALKKFTSRNG